MIFSPSPATFSKLNINTHPQSKAPKPTNHVESTSASLHIRCPSSNRGRRIPILHLRCQRWNSSRDIRSSARSKRASRQRRHPLPNPLAPKAHHLRCPHQATKHQHHNGIQRSPNGQPNPSSPPPTRSPDAPQDLSSMFSSSNNRSPNTITHAV